MALDYSTGYLSAPRRMLSLAVTPVFWMADVPGRLLDSLRYLYEDRHQLAAENESLSRQVLLLGQALQKKEFIEKQNSNLKALLNGSVPLKDTVTVVEQLGIAPEPSVRQILLDRGTHDGVVAGQAVLDATGVVGQVVSVDMLVSRAMLITDAKSRIPVQVNRSGYAAIAAGTAKGKLLELLHVPFTEDIREGDLLVTSGMGQLFPRGYPVADVTRVERKKNHHFLTVHARPRARLANNRLLVLLSRGRKNTKKQEPSSVTNDLVNNTGVVPASRQGDGP